MLTLGALSVFRWIESRLPVLTYARMEVRTRRQDKLSLDGLRKLALQHGCTLANPSYRLEQDGEIFRLRGYAPTRDRENYRRLARIPVAQPKNSRIPHPPDQRLITSCRGDLHDFSGSGQALLIESLPIQLLPSSIVPGGRRLKTRFTFNRSGTHHSRHG